MKLRSAFDTETEADTQTVLTSHWSTLEQWSVDRLGGNGHQPKEAASEKGNQRGLDQPVEVLQRSINTRTFKVYGRLLGEDGRATRHIPVDPWLTSTGSRSNSHTRGSHS